MTSSRVVDVAAALLSLAAPLSAAADPVTWHVTREMAVGEGSQVVAMLDAAGVASGCGAPMHRSGDGGRSWSPSYNRELCGYCVELVPGLALSCVGRERMLRSTDGGVHWSPGALFSQSPAPHHVRHLSFLDARRGLVATDQELGLTDDGAMSWRRPGRPPGRDGIAAVSLSEEGGRPVLRVLDEDGALWRSDDEGRSWAAAPSPVRQRVVEAVRGPAAALRFRGAEGVLAAILDEDDPPAGRVYRTRDGGKTWAEERTEPALQAAVLTLTWDGAALLALDVNAARARVFEAVRRPGGP